MSIYDTAQGRRSAILTKLRENASVSVAQLSEMFGVSEVTVRKDLGVLKDRGLLVRVHGGAILEAAVSEEDHEVNSFNYKKNLNVKEKEAIGKAAAAHIKDGDTIMVDSGSTALEVVRNLGSLHDLTIITNSVSAMLEALKYNRFKVILIGGTVRGASLSTVGAIAEQSLKLFYCDKLFLGVDSFSLENGLSTPSVEEASTNQVMISRAKEVIAVFDSTKIDKRALAFIAMPEKLNTVIIDDKLSPEVYRQLREMNINVELVKA